MRRSLVTPALPEPNSVVPSCWEANCFDRLERDEINGERREVGGNGGEKREGEPSCWLSLLLFPTTNCMMPFPLLVRDTVSFDSSVDSVHLSVAPSIQTLKYFGFLDISFKF